MRMITVHVLLNNLQHSTLLELIPNGFGILLHECSEHLEEERCGAFRTYPEEGHKGERRAAVPLLRRQAEGDENFL